MGIATPYSSPPAIARGVVIALRLFDVAYAIDLPKAETLWAAQPRPASRGRLSFIPPKAMAFGVPPVELTLDPVALVLEGVAVQANVVVRVYDFGAVSFALHVAVQDLPWDDFVRRVNAMDLLVGAGAETDVWSKLLAKVLSLLGPALIRPQPSALEEDYLIGLVHTFDTPLTAAQVWERCDLVPLLSGETRPLSDGARQDLLRQRFSYYVDDLAVITWDRAFIYEPRGDSDVIDVLEVANAQLLELRYYDELLDDELPRMYELVGRARLATATLAARKFANLARRLYTLVAEVTELTERVDNALQVTEDVYLARVYTAALDLYRVPAVNAAVERKLAIIRDTYAALYDESSSRRAELMEFLILLLIAVEIVLALVRW